MAVIFYGLEVVYGFCERRMCRSILLGQFHSRPKGVAHFFVFGHWGMFAALAYGDIRLGLKYTEGRDGWSSLQMLL